MKMLLFATMLGACAPTLDSGPPEPTPTPTPVPPGPGCDYASVQESDVCVDWEPVEEWANLEDPCPTFWDAVDLDEGGWTSPMRISDLDFDALTPVEPATAYELRRGTKYDEEDPQVLSSFGTRCDDATDQPACEAAVDAIEPLDDQAGIRNDCAWKCWWTYIVWTRGDEVGLIDSLEDTAAFLGELDSAADATLYLYAAREDHWWSDADLQRGAIREVDDGWEFIALKTIWWGPIREDRYWLHVATDGTVTGLDRSVHAIECDTIVGR